MLRVLVVGFGDIAGRGIRSILRGPDILVTECGTEAMTAVVAGVRPDVLVLEAGPRGGGALAARLTAGAPGATVVLCSAHRTDLRVFPASGGSFTRPLSERTLIESVRGAG